MKFEEALKAYNGGILRGAQTRLARAVDVAPNTVSQWVSGLIPGEEIRPKVAKELGVSVDKLLAMFLREPDGSSMIREISTEISTWVNVPIMGRAPAGEPREAFETFLGFYPAPAALVRGDVKRFVCVRAVGESMIGLQIRDGDTMLLHLQEEASDGDIVVAHVEGEGVTCKTFRLKKSVPSLEAANPASKPIVGKSFRIIGKVIWRGG